MSFNIVIPGLFDTDDRIQGFEGIAIISFVRVLDGPSPHQ